MHVSRRAGQGKSTVLDVLCDDFPLAAKGLHLSVRLTLNDRQCIDEELEGGKSLAVDADQSLAWRMLHEFVS